MAVMLRSIDRYRLQQVLAETSRVVVYRAYDPELKREVAIKTISDGLSPELVAQFRERVRREGTLAGGLKHPGIVTLYDSVSNDKRPYLVMELLRGTSLEKSAPMPFGEALRVVTQVGAALDALHAEAVVHRDVKPQNVFLESTGRVVLIDFGDAIMSGGGSGSGHPGTPPFAAPELFERGPALPASDLFSLGVLFFWLVSGKLPIPGDTVAEQVRALREGERIPLLSVLPNVSPTVSDVITRMLAGRPGDRFGSGADFVQALQVAAQPHSSAAPPNLPVRTPSSAGQSAPAALGRTFDLTRVNSRARPGLLFEAGEEVAQVIASRRVENSSQRSRSRRRVIAVAFLFVALLAGGVVMLLSTQRTPRQTGDVTTFSLPAGAVPDTERPLSELSPTEVALRISDPQASEDSVVAAMAEGVRQRVPRLVDALGVALKRPEAVVRQKAIEALVAVGDRRGAEFLPPLIDDNDVGVRRAAMHALGRLGTRAMVPFLEQRLIAESGADDQRVLAEAIEQISGVPAHEVLARANAAR